MRMPQLRHTRVTSDAVLAHRKRNKKYRDWAVQKFKKEINAYKVERGCVDCGFDKWPEALHFDHIDPHTKTAENGWLQGTAGDNRKARGTMNTYASFQRYMQHIETYCEVRCANCHAHRTHIEKHYTLRRGEIAPDQQECDLTLF